MNYDNSTNTHLTNPTVHSRDSELFFQKKGGNKKALSSVSTADHSQATASTNHSSSSAKKSHPLKKVKKAIIVTLTQASFDFDESEEQPSVEQYLGYYERMKAKFKRLFVQEFHTKEILMFSMELFRKVIANAEQSGTSFNRENDSLFKIYVTCFFIANKFVDEMHYIGMEDIAYMGHTSEEVIRSLEVALLNDVLGWNLLSLKACDSKGRYHFLRWDYRQVLKCFRKMYPDY